MTDDKFRTGEVTISFTLEGRGSFSGTGPTDAVFQALEWFRSDAAATPAPATQRKPPAQPEANSGGEALAPPDEGDRQTQDILPLAPYLKSKSPKTNPEAVAVMAVWAKKKNSTSEFTAASLGELWRLSGRKASGNLNRDVIEAARSGWLHRTGQGKYTTTTFGELFVEGLPTKKKD